MPDGLDAESVRDEGRRFYEPASATPPNVRLHSMRRFAVPIAVLAVALPLAAGCGGGGGSSSTTTSGGTMTSTETTAAAGDWANGFCSAFKDWTAALKPIAQSLQNTPTKANLQSSVGDINDANETLADDLKGLGKPDVSGGGQAKDVVDKLADQIKSDSDQIAGSLDNVSTTSDLVAAAGVVTNTLLTLQTQVADALSQLKTISANAKDSLKSAITNATACQSVNG